MSKNTEQQLQELFEEHFSTKPTSIEALPQSGSSRKYFRLKDEEGHQALGAFNDHVAENNTYFYFTELLRKHEVHVPEVYKIARSRKAYLLQDLGNLTLFDLLQAEGHTDEVKNYYKLALQQLAKFQWIAGRDVDFNQCYGTKQFDEQAIAADLLYFKYYFADLQHSQYDKVELQDQMQQWSKELSRVQPQLLMYRDFQSRNIMLHQGKVYFIDFQGAMLGAAHYDIASLLWQAKAKLPAAWKDQLMHTYLDAVTNLQIRFDEIHFQKMYQHFVLLRMLQTLGAYGFRGTIERKPHFLSSIGPALEQLHNFLQSNPQLPPYSELKNLLEQITSKEQRAKHQLPVLETPAALRVTINSFSYKNGYPVEEGSHGGGFVFDCRGLLNPGRINKYKTLSGKDNEVKQYLETKTDMPDFLNHVRSLINITVKDYIARGFEALSINFGCTGGQHRSVYAAEQLTRYLQDQFKLSVSLNHLNEKNWVK